MVGGTFFQGGLMGTKLELAASPLPSRGPKSGYVTPAFSGPQQRGQNQNWLHVICLCIVDSG